MYAKRPPPQESVTEDSTNPLTFLKVFSHSLFFFFLLAPLHSVLGSPLLLLFMLAVGAKTSLFSTLSSFSVATSEGLFYSVSPNEQFRPIGIWLVIAAAAGQGVGRSRGGPPARHRARHLPRISLLHYNNSVYSKTERRYRSSSSACVFLSLSKLFLPPTSTLICGGSEDNEIKCYSREEKGEKEGLKKEEKTDFSSCLDTSAAKGFCMQRGRRIF
jgi:hypothetical protein